MTEWNGNATFDTEIRVELIKSDASDQMVVNAARVSTQGDDVEAAEALGGNKGLIRFLMRNRHGSPFEHIGFTWLVTAPIFVWREHMRHRIASYNEESGRYTQLKPHFYLPSSVRPLVQVGKPGAYEFVAGTEEQHDLVFGNLAAQSIEAYATYVDLLNAGVAKEVARMTLPLNIMSSAYVTMNARALMNFLSLRTKNPDSAYPSYPQAEIEMVAREYEAALADYAPLTYQAFVEFGRVQP